jgi:hypothetical protein
VAHRVEALSNHKQQKIKAMRIKLNNNFNPAGAICVVSAALLIPALGIEKPIAGEALKSKDSKDAVVEDTPKEVKKLAMLGVAGMATSDTLSLHLGLVQGNGLTLYHIVPGSAADNAGLKTHDVLTELAGKKINNQNDLREVVLQKTPGDKVEVKYFSRGKAKKIEIELGQRKNAGHLRQQPGIDVQWLQRNIGREMPPAEILPMKKELMKRLQDIQGQMMQGQGGAMKFDIGKLLMQGAGAADGDQIMRFGVGTSVTFMDNDGSISMKSNNGDKKVIVKDKAGNILYEGPYETDHDKAAVPDEIRERIDKLNIDKAGGGLKLNLIPREVPPMPQEREPDGEAAE